MQFRIRPIARHDIQRRFTRGGAGIAGVAIASTLLLGLGVGAASAAPLPTDRPVSTTSQCQSAEHVVRALQKIPANLKAALKNLKSLPKSDRAAAAKTIRQDALNGTYGADAQARAEKAHGRAISVWADVPAALRADLKAAKAATPADRPALVKAIGAKAISGGYGDAVEAAAKKIQSSDFWTTCVAN